VTIRNGKLVKATQRNALKIFGQPVRRSQVLSTWQNLNDLYLAYTGRPVTLRAVKDILASGKSRYQVIDILSKGPHFVGSPVWKQNAPGYEAVWKHLRAGLEPGRERDQVRDRQQPRRRRVRLHAPLEARLRELAGVQGQRGNPLLRLHEGLRGA
jgi:hypothetical protein